MSLLSNAIARKESDVKSDGKLLPPAARLIEKRSSFVQGTCYANFLGEPCGPLSATAYDALGAIFAAYKGQPVENRHAAAKRAFELCNNRYGHKRIGKLHWEQAFELLRDAGT